jgi:hypothetical protein
MNPAVNLLASTYLILPPFLFICRWIVQNYTIQRQIKRNGGSNSVDWYDQHGQAGCYMYG